MKKVVFFAISIFLLLAIAGCPEKYFVFPLNFEDQWVNEGETLEFDLRDYTKAKDIDTVTFEIVGEDTLWEIVDESIFRFENVPWSEDPYVVTVRAINSKERTATDSFNVHVNKMYELSVGKIGQGAVKIDGE